jgi:hypothetical protein
VQTILKIFKYIYLGRIMNDSKKLAQKIITKQGMLAEKRRKWEEVWEEVADYLLPYFDFYIAKNLEARGQKPGTLIYNGSPINASQFFANGLQGYLVSSNMTWFRTQMENDAIDDLPEVREWLQEVDRIFYSEFQRTNFYSSINEFFRVGGTICTSTLYIEEDLNEKKIVFNNRHPYEIFIDVNKYNQVDTVYRKFKVTARVAAQQFGKENLTKNILKALDNQDDMEFEFIHAVEPREERKEWKLDAKNKKFASCYVCLDDADIISESGYDLLPYAVWRPEKNHHQIYGGGPGINALVDIMGLNQVTKTLLMSAQQAVNPAMQTNETMKGKVRIFPGGISYYARAEEEIKPVHVPSQFPFGKDREDKMEYIIRKHFFVDFFIMLENIERQMTATEIMERQSEKAAMLGPMIGNLNNDVLNPIFDIVFSKLEEAKRFPPIPPALERYAGEEGIKIDYIGPLAQAQKRSLQAQGLQRGLEAIVPLMQVRPEIADIINWDETARKMMEAYGMPQKIINREEDVQKTREARQQQMQQQQAMEQAGQMADAAGKINKKTEEGSMLEKVEAEINKQGVK